MPEIEEMETVISQEEAARRYAAGEIERLSVVPSRDSHGATAVALVAVAIEPPRGQEPAGRVTYTVQMGSYLDHPDALHVAETLREIVEAAADPVWPGEAQEAEG